MKNGEIYIGTSGWKYKHWNAVFYPKDLKQKDQLSYYHDIFNTVEINNSFYRQPSPENFEAWKAAVPSPFKFAVKGNKYFTHNKKLKVAADDLDQFLASAMHLGEHLGPILFQLPPSWKINIERLVSFLKLLPDDMRFAFEFRNHTWYHPEIYDLLAKHRASFCLYELDGHISPEVHTADFVYVRLHGPGEKYQGSYDDKVLALWAKFAEDNAKLGKTVYIYFDNDQNAYAAFNAQKLWEMLKLR